MSKKTKNLQYYEGIGRRKKAVARVRLYLPGKDKTAQINGLKVKAGEVYVNGKPIETIFAQKTEEKIYRLPLEITESTDRFAISINVSGGGRKGQVEAIAHGIAKALILVDEKEYKPILRKYGLLTRDPRVRQRRQVGTGGKARRKKQSPKR
ncbi:MAG: 30S ribosomal protein S9 [Microgenomates group bacterium]